MGIGVRMSNHYYARLAINYFSILYIMAMR